MTKRVIISRS